jgi:hypothetical protein
MSTSVPIVKPGKHRDNEQRRGGHQTVLDTHQSDFDRPLDPLKKPAVSFDQPIDKGGDPGVERDYLVFETEHE